MRGNSVSRTPSDVSVIAELAIQLDGFKNIDLFSQGVYQVRVRAKAECSGRLAAPLNICEMPLPQLSAAVNKDQLLPQHIHDHTGDACTHAFRVRYCEEEAALGMLARFRVELMLLPAATGAADKAYCEDIILELRLAHARSMTAFELSGDAESQSLASFTEVAMQRLRLKLPLPGIATFFPCTFDDFHFAYCPLVVHTALLELKVPATLNLAAAGSSGTTLRPKTELQRSSSTSSRSPILGATCRQHAAVENDAPTHLFAQLRTTPAFAGIVGAESATHDVGTPPDARHRAFLAYAAVLMRTHEAMRRDIAQQRTLEKSCAVDSRGSCECGELAAYATKSVAVARATQPAQALMDEEKSGELQLPDGPCIDHGYEGFGAGAGSVHVIAGDQDGGSFGDPCFGASSDKQTSSEYTTTKLRLAAAVNGGTGAGAPPTPLVGKGWLGLAPEAWASTVASTLHELAAQSWRQWQLYLAGVLRYGVTPSQTGALSMMFLCERAARYAQQVQRESLEFDQRAHREQGVGTLAHATALRDALACTPPTASAPRQHLADEALRKSAWPWLFEQTYLRRPTGDEANGDGAAAAAAAAPSTAHAVIAAARAEAEEGEAISSPLPAQLLLSWMKLGRGNGAGSNRVSAVGGGRMHLYIFVHGFHGNAYDLRGLRN